MLIIAHRCGPERHPEQTIASAKDALAVGAAYVEMDVRLTADGLPVICHDPNARRFFGVDRKIADMTSAEFLSMRHQPRTAYPSHSVEHFLQSGIKNILFHCTVSGEQLTRLLEMCRQYGVERDVVFGLMRVEDVLLVKRFNPEIGVLAFMPNAPTNEGIAQNIRDFADAGADYIRLWEHWDVENLAPVITECGKKIWIMANNPEVENTDCGYTTAPKLRHFREMGVHGVLVNNPSFCMTVL